MAVTRPARLRPVPPPQTGYARAVREETEAMRAALAGTPLAGKVWLVGGCVRDELLGLPAPKDVDLVVEGDALAVARLLFEKGVAAYPPVTYPRFGTAQVIVGGLQVELVTARRESYRGDSRKPDVEPATLDEDARRRDFTVNALFRNLDTGEPADPLGTGFDDLRRRVLRTPQEPEATFSEDPLRMLRAVRFRRQLGFEPAPGLYEAIRAEGHRLEIVSAERIRDEFSRMLQLPNAHLALEDLRQTGLLERFAPELAALAGVEQGDYHHLDVWHHTLEVVRNTRKEDLVLVLAALLHDVGKPATRTTDDEGRTRFFGHEQVGRTMAVAFLRRLRYSSEVCADVGQLVRHHMRLLSARRLSDPAARRLIRDLGDQLDRLLDLVEADGKGLKAGAPTLDLSAIRAKVEHVRRRTPASVLESPLSGEEIMALLALEPGPGVGRAKAWLREQVILGRLAVGDRAAARLLLRERFGGQ